MMWQASTCRVAAPHLADHDHLMDSTLTAVRPGLSRANHQRCCFGWLATFSASA